VNKVRTLIACFCILFRKATIFGGSPLQTSSSRRMPRSLFSFVWRTDRKDIVSIADYPHVINDSNSAPTPKQLPRARKKIDSVFNFTSDQVKFHNVHIWDYTLLDGGSRRQFSSAERESRETRQKDPFSLRNLHLRKTNDIWTDEQSTACTFDSRSRSIPRH